MIKYMYGVPYIAHSPGLRPDEPAFVGTFTAHSTDEGARRLNNLYKLGHKYRVWPLVWDILITFSEYIELGYAGDRFPKAIELADQMNKSGDWLLAYILRACKHNIKKVVQDFDFLRALERTPQLSVQLLKYVGGMLNDRDVSDYEGLRVRCPGCRQSFTLHKSYVSDKEWVCGWCKHRAPAGPQWDEHSS